MTLTELGSYSHWEGKTPAAVLEAVKLHGGWRAVFVGMPRWASRIRNYFNVFPRQLKRLDSDTRSAYTTNAQRAGCRDSVGGTVARALNVPLPHNAPVCASNLALSGDAYEDETGRVWLVTSTGGAVLHYGDKPRWALARSYSATLAGQAKTPVFKLVSPDGSGGSRECIIQNVNWSSMLSEVGVWARVEDLHVKDPVQVGSYNYSESAVVGFGHHEMHDMDPDPGEASFFINPPGDLFSKLQERVFPKDPGTRSLRESTVPISRAAADELRKLQKR